MLQKLICSVLLRKVTHTRMDAHTSLPLLGLLSEPKIIHFCRQLVTEEIDCRQFIHGMQTDNGVLLANLARRLLLNYGQIPAPHLTLIADLGRATSITGFIQVTSADGLQLLQVSF